MGFIEKENEERSAGHASGGNSPTGTREGARVRLADAEEEMRRCIVSLRLETDDEVWRDVNKKFAAFSHAAWDAHNLHDAIDLPC
jgi:hypothetical protein